MSQFPWRPLLAALVMATACGLVWLRQMLADAAAPAPIAFVETRAEGAHAVELTLTFDAEVDAFAGTAAASARSVELLWRGQPLFASNDRVPRGRPIVVPAPDLTRGSNEFYLRCLVGEAAGEFDGASPSHDPFASTAPTPGSAPLARAVRVRVLRDGLPIAETTLWSEPGAPVEGVARVEIP